jgi:hypothetical protein
LGKEHPDIARTLQEIAELYHKMGDYNKAETYSQVFIQFISHKIKLNREH